MKFRGNVFVANWPKGFKDEQLAEAFDRFGIVLGAFLARDPVTGATKGYGLVDLAPQRVAAEAVKAMNGTEIGGRKVDVRLADPDMSLTMPRSSRPAPRHPHMPAEHRASSERTPAQRAVLVEYRSLARRP
jgi:RNA recognition motif-containing protein